jgi:ParB-like chromosome segregation protein Spo0J
VAAMFPLLEGPPHETFKGDIEADGLLEPIVVQGRTLLDGRNRLRACLDLNIEPDIREYDGALDAYHYILAKNLDRRDLTPEQRTAVCTRAHAWYKVERARLKQLAGKSDDGTAGGRGRRKNLTPKSGEGFSDRHTRETVGQIAAEAKTSRYKAAQAVSLLKNAPAELEAVAAGTQSLSQAVKKAAGKKEQPREPPSYLDDVTRWLHKTRRLLEKYPAKCEDINRHFSKLLNELRRSSK